MSAPLNYAKLGSLNGKKRRVARPNELESQNPIIDDVTNTSGDNLPIPSGDNLPIPSEEGGIDPGSYDVRANKVMVPEAPPEVPQDTETPEEKNALTTIGQYLSQGRQDPGEEYFSKVAKEAQASPYGRRHDGTNKGQGWMGPQQMQDNSGKTATELTTGVNVDGKEMQIPLIVPTLEQEELNHLLQGGRPTPEIMQKAIDHAKGLEEQGLSAYAPEQESQGVFSKMGQYLGGIGQAKAAPPPVEGIPGEVNAMQETNQYPEEKGYLSQAGDFLNKLGPDRESMIQQGEQAQPKQIPQEPSQPTQSSDEYQTQYTIPTENGDVNVDDVNKVYTDPTVLDRVRETFGTDIDGQKLALMNDLAKSASQYGKSMEEASAVLTEEQMKIKQRMEGGDLSSMEKALMGLVVLAPALIGGAIGGKEAFMGGLAGGAKGLGDVLQRKEERSLADQERMSELGIKKAGLASKKQDQELKSFEMNQKINELTSNQDLANTFKRDGKIINGDLVLDTGNPLLPLKANAIKSPDALKHFMTVDKPALQKYLDGLNLSRNISDEARDIIRQLQENRANKNQLQKVASGAFPNIYETAAAGLKAYVPGLRDEIMFHGKKMKADVALKALFSQQGDAYRRMQTTGGNAVASNFAHVGEQLAKDTFDKEGFLEGRSSLENILGQLDIFDIKMVDTAMSAAEQAGVDTTPIREKYLGKTFDKKGQGSSQDQGEFLFQQMKGQRNG